MCVIISLRKVDPIGAQGKVLEVARKLRLGVTVAVAHEIAIQNSGN